MTFPKGVFALRCPSPNALLPHWCLALAHDPTSRHGRGRKRGAVARGMLAPAVRPGYLDRFGQRRSVAHDHRFVPMEQMTQGGIEADSLYRFFRAGEEE